MRVSRTPGRRVDDRGGRGWRGCPQSLRSVGRRRRAGPRPWRIAARSHHRERRARRCRMGSELYRPMGRPHLPALRRAHRQAHAGRRARLAYRSASFFRRAQCRALHRGMRTAVPFSFFPGTSKFWWERPKFPIRGDPGRTAPVRRGNGIPAAHRDQPVSQGEALGPRHQISRLPECGLCRTRRETNRRPLLGGISCTITRQKARRA